MNDYQFSVVGSGYVGMSLATLISEKYPVKILDIDLNSTLEKRVVSQQIQL